MRKPYINIKYWFLAVIVSYICNVGYAQPVKASLPTSITNIRQSFGSGNSFIKNIGQYGDGISHHGHLGKILFAYEGLDMPVLFTQNGVVFLQRKIEKISHREEERLEKLGVPEEEIEQKKIVTDRLITMEWMGANRKAEAIAEQQTTDYHTYASVQGKAYGYKKITYKNIYPGIDVVYSFSTDGKAGFEYSVVVNPGADAGLVQLKYDGDVKSIAVDSKGNLLTRSDINGITASAPQSFYVNHQDSKSSAVTSQYKVEGNTLSFLFPQGYDHSKVLIIDPFITSTTNLVGLNAGKAKDVDFDYAGNIYVTGGGNSTVHQLAKYNASGTLLWTFSGTLTIPSWSFGSYWGGWMVEKPTGNIYLGQGFNPTTGFQVIRVSTTGLYDNYITTANPNFREAWKMLWSCNNGSPEILVAGGGTNSNINFGVFTPPSTSISSLNVTGIPYTGTAGWAQDIVDFVIDPANNDMYTIYGSLIGNPSLTDKIYKNTAPYSGASVSWSVPSGFTSVQEIANRPYLIGGQIDNSANIFAINASYLFYWDGKNLKAFNKVNGSAAGTPLITGNTKLMQGGIIADACSNVFVGEANGLVKVYKFNGASFDDAAAPDISIPGFAGKAVYDLAYDEAKKLLYASGDGFVASFDVSGYCPTTQYSLSVVPDCINATASVSVNPAPLPGSTITYVLSAAGVQLASNTNGIFAGLQPNVSYSVVATINQLCSGTQASISFTLPGATIAINQNNATCGSNTGSLVATASGATAPYTYSLDGITYQPNGSFTNLAAGVYMVHVKDANGCKSTQAVTILNTNGPSINYTKANAACGNNNGTITAQVTGGTSPYQYSIDGTTFHANNFFTGLTDGDYTLTVKDASNCTNAVVVTIGSSPQPVLTAIPASATCGSSNGSITAFGSGGTGPLAYSINGNIFQANNIFTNLTPGPYTITVKDANGCTNTATVTIDNSAAPSVSATATPAACNNVNGIITASASGGIAPLQYSINGTTFQTSNIFTGLAAGVYTVTVKDNTGCTNITSVTVASTGGPSVTATSTSSACNVNTGTITATATGGAPGYQYSINGTTFQVSNTFTALAGGNYVVYVRDAAGCTGTTRVVVANTAGPSLSAVGTSTSCNANNGTITATGTGGGGGLQYSIDGAIYQPSNVFTGLGTGLYTVYVKDINGCIKATTVTIVNTSGLSLAASSIASSCSSNSGAITATATGGIAPLQYSINGVTYQAANNFAGLGAGNYVVYVKDNNGCIVTKQVSVTSVSGPSLVVAVQQHATCGSASGVIIATGSGGVPPLTYSMDGSAFQSSGTFINVTPGVHAIVVKDATGCLAPSQSVTITNSGSGTAPTDVTFTVRDVLPCTANLGRIKNIKGIPSGGGNKYMFSLDGGPFTNANQFTDVPPGIHTITARNESGCTVTRIAVLGTGTPATATATVTASACNASTGSITIAGVGPNTPYHASIDNGGTWQTFFPPGANSFTYTNLAPGTYKILMADDADFVAGPPDDPGVCIATLFVVVPSTGGPSINTTRVNASCNLNNGSIDAIGSGGTSPYTYSINGGAFLGSGTFNNLAPGSYAISVKDATGCITGANVILAASPIPALSAIVQPTSCNGNNGSITASVFGGIPPYRYSIDGTSFQSSNSFINVPAGNYTLYATDTNGCYAMLAVTIINTPLPKVTAFTIAASCNSSDGSIVATGSQGEAPYTYSIDGSAYQTSNIFNNLSSGFYAVYVKDARGCVSTTGVSIANDAAPSFTNAITSASCGNANGSITITATGGVPAYQYSINGTTFTTNNTFTALAAATYTISVKDANGCVTAKPVLVTNINGPQTLTATIVDAGCGSNNGSIAAAATGGAAPLAYSINGTNYQPSAVFNNVAAGNYVLYVKDANNCVKTLPIALQHLPAPALATSSSPASCGESDGTITTVATGGTLPITYSIDGITYQSSNIFLDLAAGAYAITAKDARGCTSTSIATVETVGASVVPVFNAVAPICVGEVLAPLPTTSLNGITGTWSPALNNTTTTTYTFVPNAGQCAATTTLTITIHPKPSSIIIYHN